jgi:hypothetical protein
MVLITIELCPKPETLPGGDKIVTCTVKNLSDYDTPPLDTYAAMPNPVYEKKQSIPAHGSISLHYIYQHSGAYWAIAYGGKSILSWYYGEPYECKRGSFEYTPTPPPTPPKHKLTISVGEGNGTTSPAPGTYEYDEGSTVSVTAYPAVLYAFDHWTLDGSSSTANPITVTMDRDHTLVAYFKSVTAAPKYTLNISSTGGGTTQPAPGAYQYDEGSTVVVTAIPYSGYFFDYWLLNGAKYTDNPITVKMTSDVTLVAYFKSAGAPTPPPTAPPTAPAPPIAPTTLLPMAVTSALLLLGLGVVFALGRRK